MAADFLSAGVNVDGTINTQATPDNTSQSTKGTSKLGKDAFLNLLVAQMKYQDPLNPTSDTEWIAQMATFSSLEEMQNMNATITNSQALNLVGKTVIMNSDDQLVGGKVDYVVMQNGKAYLAIKDSLYSIDDLDTVADEEYLEKLEGEDKEEEPTPEEKLLEAMEALTGKMDSVGTSMEHAADSIVDAVDSIISAGNENNASDKEVTDEISKPAETDKTEGADKTGENGAEDVPAGAEGAVENGGTVDTDKTAE